jgi:hypothetical protein
MLGNTDVTFSFGVLFFLQISNIMQGKQVLLYVLIHYHTAVSPIMPRGDNRPITSLVALTLFTDHLYDTIRMFPLESSGTEEGQVVCWNESCKNAMRAAALSVCPSAFNKT